LVQGGELIGVLKLANKYPDPNNLSGDFALDDETTGRIIAAGIARTVKQYQQRENALALLSEIDRRYMKNRDADSALMYMVENLDRAIPGVWGALYRYDPGKNALSLADFRAKEGRPPGKTDGGHISAAIRNKGPLYIEDARNSTEHRQLLSRDISDEAKAYVRSIGSEYAAPLIVASRTYGVLCLHKAEKSAFALADTLTADDLVARASLLLEHHELLDSRRRLYDASLNIQTELRPDELLKAVVERIRDIGYDRARLYLISSDGERIESVAQVGIEDAEKARRFEDRKITGELGEDLCVRLVNGLPEIRNSDLVTHVLEHGVPAIYVKKESDSYETIRERDTEGIMVYVAASGDDQKENLERASVDEWLDFPLIASGVFVCKFEYTDKLSTLH
ncbi:GAF domain-containing protein, partial [Candidatus Poribacteria bacterium]